MEKKMERIEKYGEGYKKYNIESLRGDKGYERMRIKLEVEGFERENIEVMKEEKKIVIRGRKKEDKESEYMNRGIEERKLKRVLVMEDGMRVMDCEIRNGIIEIDMERKEKERMIKRIEIEVKEWYELSKC